MMKKWRVKEVSQTSMRFGPHPQLWHKSFATREAAIKGIKIAIGEENALEPEEVQLDEDGDNFWFDDGTWFIVTQDTD